MNKGVPDIPLMSLGIAWTFVIALLLLLPREYRRGNAGILLAGLRMTLQLTAAGYLLQFLFEHPSPLISLSVVAVMEAFAVHTVCHRSDGALPAGMIPMVALAMTAGTTASLFFFVCAVISLSPWFSPQSFIPLAGMIIGNSMTGASLALTGLTTGLRDQRPMIETALMLGGRPERIIADIRRRTFVNALLPTINAMTGMGIVFLPGMMTGQILAGAAPLSAIKYQIVIMCAILSSVILTALLMTRMGAQTFFNERAQLKD
ncbi:MAG: ABC transporter permease [Fibrobacterota bacterium]